MIIEPVSQLGLARHLIVSLNDKNSKITIETPNIVTYSGEFEGGVPGRLFSFATSYKLHENGIIRFPRADYIPYENKVVRSGSVGVVIGNPGESLYDLNLVFVIVPSSISRSYRKTLDLIVNIRRRMRDDAILYLSGDIRPESIPLLFYFGVDLVDDVRIAFSKNPEVKIRRIIKMARKIRKLIDNKKLRDYIEILGRLSQYNASLIKIGERKYYKDLERGYPVIFEGTTTMTVFEEALNRPDVRRFVERIRKYYAPPKTRRILLIIPCSYRKPYSKSKTHRILRGAILNVKNHFRIHEVIVTSPLGAIPRELEYVYPVKNYDVPVTGTWSEEEIKTINESLRAIINRGNYEAIVAHVPEDYRFIESTGDVIFTVKEGEKITDQEALKRLTKVLNDLTQDLEQLNKREYLKEGVLGVLSYQFLGNHDDISFDSVKGRSLENSKIFLEGRQVASFDPRRGYYSLTLLGAEMLMTSGIFWVEIDDFIPKGSVFAAGIVDADEKIREGDEVIVRHEDEIRAVGIARMNGKMMKDSSRGQAVKVRHHVQRT